MTDEEFAELQSRQELLIRLTVEISKEELRIINDAVERSRQSISAVVCHGIRMLETDDGRVD